MFIKKNLDIYEQDRQCTYNVTMRRVRKSLPGNCNKSTTYWSVYVRTCVRKLGTRACVGVHARTCM